MTAIGVSPIADYIAWKNTQRSLEPILNAPKPPPYAPPVTFQPTPFPPPFPNILGSTPTPPTGWTSPTWTPNLPPAVTLPLARSTPSWPSLGGTKGNRIGASPIPDPVFIVTQSRWPAGFGATWGYHQKAGWLDAVVAPYKNFYWVQQQLGIAKGLLWEQYHPHGPR